MTEQTVGYEAAPGSGGRTVRGDGARAIRRAASVPYYAQLAEILRAQIAEEASPGDPLPSESELCALYRLSRTVVRQALDELVAEGLVVKERGRGTFVARPKIADIVIQEFRGFADEMSAHGHAVGTTVLAQHVVGAPALIALDLGVAPHEDVVHIARVRDIDGEPVVKVDSWLPAKRFPGLADADLGARSLYAILRDDHGVEARGGWRRIEAAVASREMATLLGVEIGSPMLHLIAVSTDERGDPFELFTAFYRGDRTSFEIRTPR